MISRSILAAIIAFAVSVSACDNNQTNADKTPIVFNPSLSTDGLAWRESSQLLITYSTEEATELTANYQYSSAAKQWNPVSENNILYAEDVKSVSKIEGFGQTSNPPTGAIYSGQNMKENYLCTRHLLCENPIMDSKSKTLKAIMDARAVHLVLNLTGEVPEQAIVTLAGEVPVKTYRNISNEGAVFVAHLKLWHVPGVTMDEDNNIGTVSPKSLFATVSYIDGTGANKALRIYYSITDNKVLVRGNEVYLTVPFPETTDEQETTATVNPAWTNTEPNN